MHGMQQTLSPGLSSRVDRMTTLHTGAEDFVGCKEVVRTSPVSVELAPLLRDFVPSCSHAGFVAAEALVVR